MQSEDSHAEIEDVSPSDVIFGEEGMPTDCSQYNNAVLFSFLSHHADLLSIEDCYQVVKQCPTETIHGNGLSTAKHILHPAIQLQKEYKHRIKSGVFAQMLTPEHPAYPLITFYGFIMLADIPGFKFANTVQDRVDTHFSSADLAITTSELIAVITQSSPFPHAMLSQIENSTRWGASNIM